MIGSKSRNLSGSRSNFDISSRLAAQYSTGTKSTRTGRLGKYSIYEQRYSTRTSSKICQLCLWIIQRLVRNKARYGTSLCGPAVRPLYNTAQATNVQCCKVDFQPAFETVSEELLCAKFTLCVQIYSQE